MDFLRKNEGTWFYFDSTNEKAGGVCVRRLSSKKAKEIEKLTVSIKTKFKRGHSQPIEIKTVNEKLEEILVVDYCIVDWKNVSIAGETPTACDRDGKALMMESDDFKQFVGEALEELGDVNKSLEEARVKNFGATSSGSSKKITATNAKNSS